MVIEHVSIFKQEKRQTKNESFPVNRFKLRRQEANRKLHALQMEALSQSVSLSKN